MQLLKFELTKRRYTLGINIIQARMQRTRFLNDRIFTILKNILAFKSTIKTNHPFIEIFSLNT